MQNWNITSLLGIGTVGTVLGICEPYDGNNDCTCHAIKYNL